MADQKQPPPNGPASLEDLYAELEGSASNPAYDKNIFGAGQGHAANAIDFGQGSIPSQIFHKGQSAYGKYKVAKEWLDGQKAAGVDVSQYYTSLSDYFNDAKKENHPDFQRDFLMDPQAKEARIKQDQQIQQDKEVDAQIADQQRKLTLKQTSTALGDMDRRSQLLDQLSKPLDVNSPYVQGIFNDIQNRSQKQAFGSGVQGGLSVANTQQGLAAAGTALEANRLDRYTSALNGLAMPGILQNGNFANGLYQQNQMNGANNAYANSLQRQQQTSGLIQGGLTAVGTGVGALAGGVGAPVGAAAGSLAGGLANSYFNPPVQRPRGYSGGN